MAKDIDQTPAARRNRGLGEDMGQRGAQAQKERTKPNKSAMGAKGAPSRSEQSFDTGARPDRDKGSEKNLGR